MFPLMPPTLTPMVKDGFTTSGAQRFKPAAPVDPTIGPRPNGGKRIGLPIAREEYLVRAADNLNDQQRRFVDFMAMGEFSASEAAIMAGYKDGPNIASTASHLIHNENIRSAIRITRDKYIDVDLGPLGYKRMKYLLTDDSVPAHVQFQAAKWTLEACGHGLQAKLAQTNMQTGKSLSDMTFDELQEFIARSRDSLNQLKSAVVTDITPTPEAT